MSARDDTAPASAPESRLDILDNPLASPSSSPSSAPPSAMALPDDNVEAADVDVPDDSSIKKTPLRIASAFDRLPDEIVQQILLTADSNSFASLTLVNAKWHSISQQAHLYAHHLARCPSYAASHKKRLERLATMLPSDDDSSNALLVELRRDFAREVKRNRFDAYLRPHRTLVRLVSNSISSSSAPGGEGMMFQASPRGHHLLAYNSSRIYVLDLRGPTIEVTRELKILRRPAATYIPDDASTLAVLLTEMQIDLYDLRQSPPRRTQSLILDHSPRAIALSPCGSVLAAAYDGGIEVSALSPGSMPTDRRAVKCDTIDALTFSFDGTQILGTTVHTAQPNTVIVTAPYYDPGSHGPSDDLSALWTTSILFPNTSRDCSHAVLLQDSAREEALWTFTYDRSFETFRAVRVDDLRNGTTYFTGPIPTSASQTRLLPCTLPAVSYHGDLVSAGFQSKDIWVYGVPEDLDAVPESAPESPEDSASGSVSSPISHSASRSSGSPTMRAASTRLQESGNSTSARVPQWQLLCDRLRNTFIPGYLIGELPGMSMVKWVEGFGDSSLRERLVVCARGVTPPKPITEDDGMDFIDGGRLLLVDFDYGLIDGTDTEITIEVGTKEPEELEEEQRDLDTEVAIVRRRTVAQRRGTHNTLLRATTTASMPRLPTHSSSSSSNNNNEDDDDDDPLRPRRIGVLPTSHHYTSSTEKAAIPSTAEEEEEEEEEGMSIMEQEALDAPYSHTSPRSGMTLRRAATAAAISRRLHPQPATTSSGAEITYRRADGRREHPHESDADNWVPPPPPYQKEDPQDLPAFLRHNVPPISAPAPTPPAPVWVPPRASHMPSDSLVSENSDPGTEQPTAHLSSRPVSVISSHTAEDLYDATPRPSPRLDESSANNSVGLAISVPGSSGPTLRTAASWDGNLRPDNIPGSQAPRPLGNAQTWSVHRPATSDPNFLVDTAAAAALPVGSRRMSLAGFQVPRVPVGMAGSSRRPSVDAATAMASTLDLNKPLPVPKEEQPLIISTPQGVSGAFDPPSANKYEQQPDTPILAPVPRHPQAQERSAMLRERFDAMSGGESSQQEQEQQQPPSTTPVTATRQSSLNRRRSRAERSAAKNIADAKKRGWRRNSRMKKGKQNADGEEMNDGDGDDNGEGDGNGGGNALTESFSLAAARLSLLSLPAQVKHNKTKAKRKKRNKERDGDGASTTGWTDITVASMRSGIEGMYHHQDVPMGPESSSAYAMQHMQQMQQQMQEHYEQYDHHEQMGGKEKFKKCAMM